MNSTVRWLLSAALVVSSAGVVGCSGEKTAGEPGETVTYEKNGRGVHVTGRDGSVSMQGDDKAGYVTIKDKAGKNMEVAYVTDGLVAGFPRDIPIYASATIAMSQLLDGRNAVATLTTADGPEAVLSFYKAELPKSGWIVENEMAMGGISVLQAVKAGRQLTLQLTRQGDETGITIAATAGENK